MLANHSKAEKRQYLHKYAVLVLTFFLTQHNVNPITKDASAEKRHSTTPYHLLMTTSPTTMHTSMVTPLNKKPLPLTIFATNKFLTIIHQLHNRQICNLFAHINF